MKENNGKKRSASERAVFLLLAAVILLQVLLCVYYGFQKKGYFVDELWGAGLANSYFRPRLFNEGVFNTNTYLPGSFFRDYLTVSPEQGFCPASVWYNQSQDSHPPLYFLLYHILSCLKPGTFSKWTGIIINLFFLAGADVGIFQAGKKISGSAAAGLTAAAVWGFSAEAVSYALCARMYMMAACFVVLFLYRTLVFYETPAQKSGREHRFDCLCLLSVTALGCLTHYYFYLAAFFLAVFTCIRMLFKRGFRAMCAYGFSVLGGVLVSWAVYPQIFESLLHGDGRGREAGRNLLTVDGISARLSKLTEQILEKLLYKPVFILATVMFCLLVVTVFLCAVGKKRIGEVLKNRVSMLLSTELLFLAFMLAVAKLQPFYTNRYYFPITPLLWIIVLGNAVLFFRVLFSGGMPEKASEGVRVRQIISAVCLIITIAAGAGVVKGHLDKKVMFLFPRQGAILARIREMDHPSALYLVSEREYTLTAHCAELAECGEVLAVSVGEPSELSAYTIHDTEEQILVYVMGKMNQDEVLRELLSETAYSRYELIGRGSGVWWEDAEENYIYVLSK